MTKTFPEFFKKFYRVSVRQINVLITIISEWELH